MQQPGPSPKPPTPVVLLMGPTASGKTEVAMALARRFPVDLISVDSALVYRGMDIGTAKPDPESLARFPHALVDIRDPEDGYSAATFVRDAREAIDRAWGRGRLPVLVGGTVLYFQALLFGLDRLPEANPVIRGRLEREAGDLGWPALHRRLARVDPASAARIAPADGQRIQRALEVHEVTGKPISALHRGRGGDQGLISLRLVLAASNRHILHERINQRLDRMIDNGFLDEVRGLMRRPGLQPDSPSMRCVGYRQAWMFLENRTSDQAFRDQARAATRQLAKRQLTWLRKMPRALWYAGERQRTMDAVFRRVGVFFHSAGLSNQVDP